MTDKKYSFSDWLRETRKERGMTLDTVAEKSGVSKSHVYYIEKGRSDATIDVADKLCMAFDVTLHSVLYKVHNHIAKDA